MPRPASASISAVTAFSRTILRLRLEVELALAARVVVVHQHRDAVRVDARQVGLDHHLGGGAARCSASMPQAVKRRLICSRTLSAGTFIQASFRLVTVLGG